MNTQHRNFSAGLIAAAGLAGILGGCAGGDGDSRTTAPAAMKIEQPSASVLAAAGLGRLDLAPSSRRVDLQAPPFSKPTRIVNPLFPISRLRSVVLSGRVEGKPFHTETTLLPETRMIEVSDGVWIEAAVSQYLAYLDGRIEEAALDYYAQADDGSVWYLGEDVFDYDAGGRIDGTEGTWLAGRDGPMQMIMPAEPRVGDVHRAENIPGIAFEELTIAAVGRTVDGPRGAVEGAIVASELHDDGTTSDKTFAPGYGEFFSAHQGDTEALALAVPTDALDAPIPARLDDLHEAGETIAGAVVRRDWSVAQRLARRAATDWRAYSSGQVPALLAAEMRRAQRRLAAGLRRRDVARAGNAGVDVSLSALDLKLRHLPPAMIDRDRFAIWTRQILVHGAAGDEGGVFGDVATLEWIRDRFADTLSLVDRTRIDRHLLELRGAVVERDADAVVGEARRLRRTLARIAR